MGKKDKKGKKKNKKKGKKFGTEPIKMKCSECKKKVTTCTEKKAGAGGWLYCCGLSCLG